MRFGVSTQLYHGRRLTRGHLEAIAAHGFDAVELVATRTHFDYRDPAAVAALESWLSETGLRLHAIHAPFVERFENGRWGPALSNASRDPGVRARAVQEAVAALDLAHRVPVEFLVVHLGLPDSQPIPAGDNDPRAARDSLEEIATVADRLGVRIAVELIPNALSTPDAIVALLEDTVDLPRVGACLDVGHAFLWGDPVEAVETLSGHVVTTHVHDNHGTRDEHLVPFDGGVEWPALLISLEKVGYEGTLMLELSDTGRAETVLQKARAARARLEAAVETWI